MTAMKIVSNTDQPVQILLAEDSDINQKIARLILEKAGFQVAVAENGRQAATACEHKRFDLILMDISMPVMDGYMAACSIREGESQTQRVPIIAMTGHAVESIRDRCLEHGMDDCIGKPMQRDRLVSMVKKWTGAQVNSGPVRTDRQQPVPIPPVSGTAPMDLDRAVKEFMGRTDVLFELLNSFVDKARQQITAIAQAAAGNDFATVCAQAHSIKGAAANLTAHRLAKTAGQLEKSAGRCPPGPCDDLVETLKAQLQQLEQFARQNCSQAPVGEQVEEQNENFDR